MINFNLQSYDENMYGLVFEFATPPFKDNVWNMTSKYLTEGAFCFIEGIIYNNVPKYQNFGHWGKTEIDKEQWSLIKSALLILKSKVDHAKNLRELKPDLFDFKFISDDYLQEMAKKFSKSQPPFSQMISDFITWADENIQKYGSIYILGI
ncbi:hypothetical protein DM558_03485 [Entomomonas moraniae]|uniref:DUF1877 family protein n=1 Tax=Entomomonas moraniae TaxID=2213226 RepID=A0A3Q9JHU5_9GAMM|nr:hypothetical protein [Entomomonas moraniae]AZS49896.1 hypothetical protein DM558_03485 [Entomomonas moraniae]